MIDLAFDLIIPYWINKSEHHSAYHKYIQLQIIHLQKIKTDAKHNKEKNKNTATDRRLCPYLTIVYSSIISRKFFNSPGKVLLSLHCLQNTPSSPWPSDHFPSFSTFSIAVTEILKFHARRFGGDPKNPSQEDLGLQSGSHIALALNKSPKLSKA